jgi:hypothetical protein
MYRRYRKPIGWSYVRWSRVQQSRVRWFLFTLTHRPT